MSGEKELWIGASYLCRDRLLLLSASAYVVNTREALRNSLLAFITPVINLVLLGEPADSLLLATKIPGVVNTSCNPCFFKEEASCWQLCISNANCLQPLPKENL